MRMHHFCVQSCPFALNKNFFRNTFHMLLGSFFFVQNLKKIHRADPELWGSTIFGPICPLPPTKKIRDPLINFVPFIHIYVKQKNQSQMSIHLWNIDDRWKLKTEISLPNGFFSYRTTFIWRFSHCSARITKNSDQ